MASRDAPIRYQSALMLQQMPKIAQLLLRNVGLGIRNAWDLVTYIAVEHLGRQDEQSKETDDTK